MTAVIMYVFVMQSPPEVEFKGVVSAVIMYFCVL